MKILIYKRKKLIESFGGIEHVMSKIANNFSNNGHNITLATADKVKGQLKFPLNDEIELINFGYLKPSLLRKFISRLTLGKIKKLSQYNYTSNFFEKYLQKEKFDLIITSGLDDSLDITYNKNITTPHICMLHSYPEVYFKQNDKRLKAIKAEVLTKNITFQVLMPSYKNILAKYTNSKIVAIGNEVETAIKSPQKRNNVIIFVGSLAPNKNQLLLVNAFAKIANKYSDWQVHLWGEKHCNKTSDNIKQIIKNNSLESQVLLKGTSDKMIKEIASAKICGFPSLYEGFSLSLSESMACGLASVGLKEAYFVNEFIKDGKTGFLTETSIDDYAEKLEKLIKDDMLREEFGANAKEFVQQYSPENINKKWEELILEVAK